VFNGDKATLGRLRRITLRSWGKDNPQSPAATAPFKRGWQHRRCWRGIAANRDLCALRAAAWAADRGLRCSRPQL